MAALLALLALPFAAFGESAVEGPSQANRAVVEALFAAAAGTSEEVERAAREGMTQEALFQRNEENAAYRAQALPWLRLALGWEAPEDAYTNVEDAEGSKAQPPDVEAIYALFGENSLGRAYIALLAAQGHADAQSCLLATQAIAAAWMAEIDAAQLTELNGDYAFWLYGPDSRIDYPVVQGTDNSYYLNRLFNGARNACGTLFVDYRNLPNFQDPNTLVYGHHMRDGSMFKSITFYADQAYYEARPYMLIMTPGGRILIQLFAGYTTRDGDSAYEIAISGAESMAEFEAKAREKSDFFGQAEIAPGDRMVTLSTCAYLFQDARYVLIGRLIPLWEAAEDALSEKAS